MGSIKKIFARLAWLTTVMFVITVVVPLAAQRLATSDQWKSHFISFQLKDETGQRHVGFVGLGTILRDAEFFEYGYEPPKGTDLSKWRQQILGMPRDQVKEIGGFVWSDKGFVWGDYKTFGAVKLEEGTRLGLDRTISKSEQLELTVPGAPWDVYSPTTSFFGRFPNYEVTFKDRNFEFDLKLTAATPAWYMYNEGRPFRAGDFGLGSMNELAVSIAGVITHKQTGETFNLSGTGLMEDAIGLPWSWIGWGTHDWCDVHFPDGWRGSLWKAQDDWQWGYHRDPHLGWLWDPELKRFLTFYRVDLIEVEYVTDQLSGLEYPKHAVWRAIGPDGTLEVENTNLTFKPRETRFPPFNISLKMSYGDNISKGRLVRRDGTVVELGIGIGTMEHFIRAIPDYVFWGPLMLVLLVVVWSAYAAAIRRQAGRSVVPPVAWCGAGLFAVWVLYIAWR